MRFRNSCRGNSLNQFKVYSYLVLLFEILKQSWEKNTIFIAHKAYWLLRFISFINKNAGKNLEGLEGLEGYEGGVVMTLVDSKFEKISI